jgi:hypothetical protein
MSVPTFNSMPISKGLQNLLEQGLGISWLDDKCTTAHDTCLSAVLLLVVTHCQIDVQLKEYVLLFGLILFIFKMAVLKQSDSSVVPIIMTYICTFATSFI